MKFFNLIIFFTGWLLIGCEEVKCPYEDERLCDPDFVPVEDVTLGMPDGTFIYESSVLNEYEPVVLLEDFTGFRCPNCLDAVETANNISNNYSDRVIIVAYHVSQQFAAPLTNDPSEPFYLDFRTPAGEELLVNYLIPALPNGMVDRKIFDNNRLQPHGNWEDRVAEEITSNPLGLVDVRDVVYDEVADLYNFNVAVKSFVDLQEDWSLFVGIYENNLIEGQKDGSETIYPFIHDHVFRRAVLGTFGQTALTTDMEVGANEVPYYSLAIKANPEWDVNECYIFAYLIRLENDEEIITCDKEPLSP
jgi:thiol-disulfide isomerase/thioredoxin